MNSEPLVSVVMPVRNGMPFLRDAVESIRSQTYNHWELIVVDDHSTDGTASYLAQLADPRMRIISNTGSGVGAAQDSGIAIARGEYTARMDADDVSCPDRLAAQVSFLNANPDLVGVGTQLSFIANGGAAPAFRMPCDPERILAGLQSGRVTFCNSSMMFRTQAARKVRRKVYGPGDDFDFFLRLTEYGGLANLPDSLLRMRITTGSLSFSQFDRQLCEITFAVVCDRARRSQTPEPNFGQYQRDWKNRPIGQRLLAKARSWHQKLYRYAIMRRGAGHTVEALACLSASAILWPPAVGYQLKNAFKHKDPHPYGVQPETAVHPQCLGPRRFDSN